MWQRKVQVQRDFFWVGVLVGLGIGALGMLGLWCGSEAGRNTCTRLGRAVQRVRDRLNGSAESNGSAASQTPPVETESADSNEL